MKCPWSKRKIIHENIPAQPSPSTEEVWTPHHGPWIFSTRCHCGYNFDPQQSNIWSIGPSISNNWDGICPRCGCEDEPKKVKGRYETEVSSINKFAYRKGKFIEWTECSLPKVEP